jgi:hypothetical protein
MTKSSSSLKLGLAIAASIAITLSTMGGAQAQSFGQIIVSESLDSTRSGLLSQGRRMGPGPYTEQVISRYSLSSEQHAMAMASAEISLNSFFGRKRDTLRNGEILYSATTDGRVFCNLIKLTPGFCLEDTNNDNSFDVSYTFHTGGQFWNFMAFLENGNMTPANFQSPRQINPIPYNIISTHSGPKVSATLSVLTNYRPGQAPHEFKGRLRFLIGDNYYNQLELFSDKIVLSEQGYASSRLLDSIVDFRMLPSGDIEYIIHRSIFVEPRQMSISPF